MNTPVATALATTASGPFLFFSLLFGVGQCIVGAALVLRGLRHGRWRRLGVYGAMILGMWAICSGIAELAVSGCTAAGLMTGVPTPATIAGVRHIADTALFVASGVLVVPLGLYPIWTRLAAHRAASATVRED